MRRASHRGIGTMFALCAVAVLCLAGCGGGDEGPATTTLTLSPPSQDELPPPPTAAVSTTASSPSNAVPASADVPQGPGVTPNPSLASPSTTGAKSDEQTITETFRTFTYLLSGLDDNLNSAWLQPLAEVTTERLAQAVTRHASAILNAHERGVGTLAGRNLTIKMTGTSAAALAECENYTDFYLVSESTDSADPGIVRGDFVGTAQLLKIHGRWYVDVYATTQTSCDF